jgi:hypothetical protein
MKDPKTTSERLIIKLDPRSTAHFCSECSKHLSEMLNTKISWIDVYNELFFYENGIESSNKSLGRFVELFLIDVKNAIDDREAQLKVKKASIKFGL